MAYWAKAKQHHPDHGGDEDAFIRVRKSYQILADPKLKAKFDSTGTIDTDPQPSFQYKVSDTLVKLFNEFLRSGKAFNKQIDIIGSMRQSINEAIVEVREPLRKQRNSKALLLKLRERITSKNSDNLFHRVIDTYVREMDNRIIELEESLSILKAAQIELNAYESIHEMAWVVGAQWKTGTSTTSTTVSTTDTF